MPQFEEEMKTERTILSEKRAHRDFDTPFIARFMFLWVQKSLIWVGVVSPFPFSPHKRMVHEEKRLDGSATEEIDEEWEPKGMIGDGRSE